MIAKKTIHEAGCRIHLLAENIPTDGSEAVLIEDLMDAIPELQQNIHRGMDHNTEHALYNRHKLFRYGVWTGRRRSTPWTSVRHPSCVGCSKSTRRTGRYSR